MKFNFQKKTLSQATKWKEYLPWKLNGGKESQINATSYESLRHKKL